MDCVTNLLEFCFHQNTVFLCKTCVVFVSLGLLLLLNTCDDPPCGTTAADCVLVQSTPRQRFPLPPCRRPSHHNAQPALPTWRSRHSYHDLLPLHVTTGNLRDTKLGLQ